MPRQSISFTEPNSDWLKSQVDSKEFSSKSDVVNNLIRNARVQEAQVKSIRKELILAERGGFTEQTPESIRQEIKQGKLS